MLRMRMLRPLPSTPHRHHVHTGHLSAEGSALSRTRKPPEPQPSLVCRVCAAAPGVRVVDDRASNTHPEPLRYDLRPAPCALHPTTPCALRPAPSRPPKHCTPPPGCQARRLAPAASPEPPPVSRRCSASGEYDILVGRGAPRPAPCPYLPRHPLRRPRAALERTATRFAPLKMAPIVIVTVAAVRSPCRARPVCGRGRSAHGPVAAGGHGHRDVRGGCVCIARPGIAAALPSHAPPRRSATSSAHGVCTTSHTCARAPVAGVGCQPLPPLPTHAALAPRGG